MLQTIRTILQTTCLIATGSIPMAVAAQDDTAYLRQTDAWHADRILDLRSESGWLNLAGLFWLEEGRNHFGSGKGNRLVFPAGKIPEKAGYLLRKGDRVTLRATRGSGIKVAGKELRQTAVFDPEAGSAPMMSCGDLRWNVIKRGERIGIRLRDLKSPALAAFDGVERYPVDSNWRVTATLIADGGARKVAITNVLGQTTEQASPGRLRFEVGGVSHTLDALEEGDELFIIFADATSGHGTYPAGRFLYARKPGADGRTVLDFNRAHNPPCAFTPFATCPLPPRQNRLSLSITAGEKDHHPE
jgi:uncharacterized protein (DUF1684 family)